MSCEMKERVLAYLKSDNRDLEIEDHLDHCRNQPEEQGIYVIILFGLLCFSLVMMSNCKLLL